MLAPRGNNSYRLENVTNFIKSFVKGIFKMDGTITDEVTEAIKSSKLISEHEIVQHKIENGTLIGKLIRYLITSVTKKIPINQRPHNYGSEVCLGPIGEIGTAKEVFEKVQKLDISITVPTFAKMKEVRSEGGIVYVFGAGSITMTSDSKNLSNTNETNEDHLFYDGKVVISFIEKGDFVWFKFVGTGEGNFAWFNEKFGKKLFEYMGNNLSKELHKKETEN